LAPEPDVLLLDEPLANLDAERRADLIGLLAGLAREGGPTTLLVTHDPGEALALGARVAVLAAGRIAEEGPGQELYARPRTAAAARALGAANLVPARREARGWATALGLLEAARTDDATARCVLVRPENLRVGPLGAREADRPGVEAIVRAVWACPRDFAVQAQVGELTFEGRSSVALEMGTRARLSVEGAVAGLNLDLPVAAPAEEQVACR
jgi:ABC-type Fe3+/spermidine/putrescine transport system ATPase subunit